ncbi:hypothetical protein [Azospirillum sp.]|uniref:hypothetical protein n=1 Tax=Azospirillum sp. TaxID=34012 RepID=UPI002D65CB8C|nr:hypothetical protein [Azospirillum sp.]HYD70476.1 hypothetical protein [Azospirillum sp.]
MMATATSLASPAAAGYRIGPADAARDFAGAKPMEGSETLLGRYPSLTFTYNQPASRLVMLIRSPVTGETENQVPSKVALRMYQELARSEPRAVKTPETGFGDAQGGEPGYKAVDIVIAAPPTAKPGGEPAAASPTFTPSAESGAERLDVRV